MNRGVANIGIAIIAGLALGACGTQGGQIGQGSSPKHQNSPKAVQPVQKGLTVDKTGFGGGETTPGMLSYGVGALITNHDKQPAWDVAVSVTAYDDQGQVVGTTPLMPHFVIAGGQTAPVAVMLNTTAPPSKVQVLAAPGYIGPAIQNTAPDGLITGTVQSATDSNGQLEYHLTGTVTNGSSQDLRDTLVHAVGLDAQGNIVAATNVTVPLLPAHAQTGFSTYGDGTVQGVTTWQVGGYAN